MHSPSRLLRKSPPLIRHIILSPDKGPHHRPFSIRSQPSVSSLSSPSSSSGGPKEEGCGGGGSSAPLWTRLSSGLLVIGSGLGLCYWSLSPAHADQGAATEFQDVPPQKKPSSLFKGVKFIQNDAYIQPLIRMV